MDNEEKVIKAVEKVSPCVVNISTIQIVQYDMFHAVPVKGMGSGIVMDTDGHILTNDHVVEGAKKVDVFTTNGKKSEGSVLGTDPTTDIAVVKIKPKDLPPAEFGIQARSGRVRQR